MKNIKFLHIICAIICVVLFVIFLFTGFFVLSACAIIGYIIIDKKYLRCKNCDAFINIDRLLYARKHTYHCHKCGNIIEIDK